MPWEPHLVALLLVAMKRERAWDLTGLSLSPSLPSSFNHQGRQEQCNLKLVPSGYWINNSFMFYNSLLAKVYILSSLVICVLLPLHFVPISTSMPFPTIATLDQPSWRLSNRSCFNFLLLFFSSQLSAFLLF